MREKINFYLEEYKNCNPHVKWELIKYQIRKFSIQFSKSKKKFIENRKKKLERKLLLLEQQEQLDSDDKHNEKTITQNLLKIIYEAEVEGSIVRSRAQWREEGEKSTAYFFSLEKQNYKKKNIQKLKVENKEITDQKAILEETMKYYKTLYTKKNYSSNFVIPESLPKLINEEREKCEGLIEKSECEKSLLLMKKGRRPGNDGLCAEVYAAFWDILAKPLIDSFNYSFEVGLLTTTQRQAIISLLSKTETDRELIVNWRPISLLCVDYKLLTKCLTERLKIVINKLIHTSQSGFIKNRNIVDGLRTILDIVEDLEEKNNPGIMIAVDYEKAYDSISWEFLFKALEHYNFGPDFLKWVKLCYTDISSCTVNNKWSSPFFKISRGLRQGDSMSSLLFNLVAEIMSYCIRQNPNIKGVIYENEEIKISSYADDSTLILLTEHDVKLAFDFLKVFEKASGLKINKGKTKGLWLGSNKYNKSKPFGIKWPKSLKILGIHISHDSELMNLKNFDEKLEKMKKKLNFWKMRDLTLYGKVLLIKTYGISQLLYVSSVLNVPRGIIDEAEQILYEFLWGGNSHKIKKNVIIQTYENGGHKMIDLNEMLKAQKLKWVIKAINDNDLIWKNTMKSIVGVKDLKIFFRHAGQINICNSRFYSEIIQIWKGLIKKEVITKQEVLSQGIWYNENILVNEKPIYYKDYHEKGVLYISSLINNDGYFKTFNEFKNEFQLDNNALRYQSIISGITKNGKISLAMIEQITS